MSGAGEAERRLTEPEPWVETRGRGVAWVVGGGCVCTEERFVLLRRRRASGDLLSGSLGDCALLAFEFGDLARLDVSLIQFRSERRWLMKGCFRLRFETKPLGWRRSGLLDTA